MVYITLLDFYRNPPKNLQQCRDARRFLKKIGTNEALSLLESVRMLEISYRDTMGKPSIVK